MGYCAGVVVRVPGRRRHSVRSSLESVGQTPLLRSWNRSTAAKRAGEKTFNQITERFT